jgi:hypothetical protein
MSKHLCVISACGPVVTCVNGVSREIVSNVHGTGALLLSILIGHRDSLV